MTRPKPYHKENLRRDLLTAARSYVADLGHLTLSLRAIAQQVGVSTAAPYHHFADRRALLLAVAVEGFEDLNGGAGAIVASDRPATERLAALAEAFLTFAAAQPRLLELMYESELTTPEVDPVLLAYQDKGYRILLDVMAQAAPHLPSLDLSVRVMALWSTIYGYAMLRNKFMLKPYEPSELPAARIDRAVIEQAVRAALTV